MRKLCSRIGVLKKELEGDGDGAAYRQRLIFGPTPRLSRKCNFGEVFFVLNWFDATLYCSR